MINLVNKKFGRLTVKSFYDIKGTNSRWLCLCDCGKETICFGNNLKRGITQSCGCLHKEKISMAVKKYNTYDLNKNFGIGWTTNTNKEFYFDKEDYNKIKEYAWFENDQGYILTRINNKNVRLHRFLLNLSNNIIIDHINTNKKDNRKSNLRESNKSTNGMNRDKPLTNTSGHKGIGYVKGKYIARIGYKNKSIYIGSYENINEAIKERKNKEIELFGGFIYDQ